jgi:hypothetical protein
LLGSVFIKKYSNFPGTITNPIQCLECAVYTVGYFVGELAVIAQLIVLMYLPHI